LREGKPCSKEKAASSVMKTSISEGMQKELNALGFNSLKDLIKSLSEK
jgi:hypothetical protein